MGVFRAVFLPGGLFRHYAGEDELASFLAFFLPVVIVVQLAWLGFTSSPLSPYHNDGGKAFFIVSLAYSVP